MPCVLVTIKNGIQILYFIKKKNNEILGELLRKYMISCITRKKITVAMAKVKWFGISFTKGGGVESGTTKHESILWQGGGFEPGTSGLQMRS